MYVCKIYSGAFLNHVKDAHYYHSIIKVTHFLSISVFILTWFVTLPALSIFHSFRSLPGTAAKSTLTISHTFIFSCSLPNDFFRSKTWFKGKTIAAAFRLKIYSSSGGYPLEGYSVTVLYPGSNQGLISMKGLISICPIVISPYLTQGTQTLHCNHTSHARAVHTKLRLPVVAWFVVICSVWRSDDVVVKEPVGYDVWPVGYEIGRW